MAQITTLRNIHSPVPSRTTRSTSIFTSSSTFTSTPASSNSIAPSTPSLSNGSSVTYSTGGSTQSGRPLPIYTLSVHSTNESSLAGHLPTQTQHHEPEGPSLPCALRFLPCAFTSEDEEEWITHTLAHFHPFGPPETATCPFCSTVFSSPTAWSSRLSHMLSHHRHSLDTQTTPEADFPVYEYLWQKGLVKDAQMKEIKGNARYGDRAGAGARASEREGEGQGEPVTYTLSASVMRDERSRRKLGRGARQGIRRF